MARIAIVTIITLLFAAFIANTAYAAGTDDARQFVDNVGKQVLAVVNSSDSADQKQIKLRNMFSQNVDIDWMAKFVLGHAWQQASEEQRTHYLQSYKEYLLTHYTTSFSDYTGSKYVITDTKNDEDGQITVNMQIKAAKDQQQETAAGYRLRNNNGQFKIVDIIVEGVSLITTERSEFSSVVQQKGMDGLISTLEQKTKSESK